MDWFFVVASIGNYTLGFVFANRVNKSVSFVVTLAGLVLLLFFNLFNYLLKEITSQSEINRSTGNHHKNQKNLFLMIALTILGAFGVGAVYVLLRFHSLQGQAAFWLAGIIIFQTLLVSNSFLYLTHAYQWLVKTFLISPLSLFLGCSLQGFAPSSAMINLGIFMFLTTASTFITLMFRQYAGDLNRNEKSFLVSVTWEKGIWLHHLIFALSVVVLFIYLMASHSLSSYWPVLAWQAFGLFEIYLLEQLVKGMKPNFALMDALAIFRVLGTQYLLIFSLLI